MPDAELIRHGQHVMTVCNSCRYCEQYCPVFPAMERRLTFTAADLAYLANLCHNCGECLYACQYAPPHEFGIDVPRTLATIRVRSYEDYCWPQSLALAFKRHNLLTGIGLAAALTAVMFAAALMANGGTLPRPTGAGDFYAVVPHGVMVGLFGSVFLFAVAALSVAMVRFWRDIESVSPVPLSLEVLRQALGDVLTLRHLHGGGEDCTSAEEKRTPWRRLFHHALFYGFMLCFASTTVAAIYHSLLGWHAPYGYASLPVVLGTAGGAGMLIGACGLMIERGRRDRSLGDPAQDGLDRAFIALLLLAALTGLVLLVRRETAMMSPLLIVHLGVVLALFLTLPYGKFVHGLYRTLALIKNAAESRREQS
jgi:citrate/tricarballylate utilization protein